MSLCVLHRLFFYIVLQILVPIIKPKTKPVNPYNAAMRSMYPTVAKAVI